MKLLTSFLIVSVLLVLNSNALPQLLGGYQTETKINEQVMEIAKWATDNLAQYTKVNGEYTALTVRNLTTQVVAGMNYKFTLDVLLGTPENKYFFHSCDLVIFDQPWTKIRYFLETPSCKINTDYPVK